MLDDDAQCVVESMPDFHPGMQRGNPVRVSYNLPFNFSLNGKFYGYSERRQKEWSEVEVLLFVVQNLIFADRT